MTEYNNPLLANYPSHDRLEELLLLLNASTPTRTALHNLLSYGIYDDSKTCLDDSKSANETGEKLRTAAVLVLITIDKATGNPYVCLTTRSRALRSHPSESAFPGGKRDDSDVSWEATALREAHEEVGLDLSHHQNLVPISVFEPFPSATFIEVHPCIYLWTSNEPPKLEANPHEVEHIFHANLYSFLGLGSGVSDNNNANGTHKSLQNDEQQIPTREIIYQHSYQDINWASHDRPYRLHIFEHESFASPITGLTAEILLHIALVAYKVPQPGFERAAPNQMLPSQILELIRLGKLKRPRRR